MLIPNLGVKLEEMHCCFFLSYELCFFLLSAQFVQYLGALAKTYSNCQGQSLCSVLTPLLLKYCSWFWYLEAKIATDIVQWGQRRATTRRLLQWRRLIIVTSALCAEQWLYYCATLQQWGNKVTVVQQAVAPKCDCLRHKKKLLHSLQSLLLTEIRRVKRKKGQWHHHSP